MQAALHDSSQVRCVGAQLGGRDALQNLGLGEEALILTCELAREHMEFVRLGKRLDEGGGFLFGLLDQGAHFPGGIMEGLVSSRWTRLVATILGHRFQGRASGRQRPKSTRQTPRVAPAG